MGGQQQFGLSPDKAPAVKEASKVFYGLMCLAASTNKNVLIDQTNLTVSTRKLKIDLFKNHEPIIAFFDRPLELIKERNCRPGKTIPEAVLKTMHFRMEKPTDKEAEVWTL